MGSMFLTEFKDFIINDLKVKENFFKITVLMDLPFLMSIIFSLISYFFIRQQTYFGDNLYYSLGVVHFILLMAFLWIIYFVAIIWGIYIDRINVSELSLGKRFRISIFSIFFSVFFFLIGKMVIIESIFIAGIFAFIFSIPCFIVLSIIFYMTALMCSIVFRYSIIKDKSCYSYSVIMNTDRFLVKELILRDLKQIGNFFRNLKLYFLDPAFLMSLLFSLLLLLNDSSSKPQMSAIQYLLLLPLYLWIIYFCVIYLGIYLDKINPSNILFAKRFKIAFWFTYFFFTFPMFVDSPIGLVDFTKVLLGMFVYGFLSLPYCILYFIAFSLFIYVSIFVFSVLFKKPLKLPTNLLLILIITILIFAFCQECNLIINYSNGASPFLIRV